MKGHSIKLTKASRKNTKHRKTLASRKPTFAQKFGDWHVKPFKK